jgi:hypothetical protein
MMYRHEPEFGGSGPRPQVGSVIVGSVLKQYNSNIMEWEVGQANGRTFLIWQPLYVCLVDYVNNTQILEA